MNDYIVEFKYAKEYVTATDSDSAVWKAFDALGLEAEDRGPLVSLKLSTDGGRTYTELMAEQPAEQLPPLPARRARGMSLTYEAGDLFVVRGQYCSSLSCAAMEGELNHSKGRFEPMQLSHADMKVVESWVENEDRYYEANGWATWAEVHGEAK